MFSGIDFMFNVFPVIFGIMFIVVISVFIINIAGQVKQWNKNNNSPVLAVDAVVTSKRTSIDVHNHTSNDNLSHRISYTNYYVTFEVESKDRFELQLNGGEYGLISEGDKGKLTFQGTRYIGFDRFR